MSTRKVSTTAPICNCDHRRGECCTCCCPGALAGKAAVELPGILKLLRAGRTTEGVALLEDMRDELAKAFWASHPDVKGAA